jgi:pteridine reductase
MRTVLITGGAKRLGKALVQKFAENGWRVMFTTRYSFEDGVYLAESLTKLHGIPVTCIRSSVSNRIEAACIANWARSQTDSLDLLICNASTFKRIPFLETLQHQLDDLLGSNLIGNFFLAQQCHDMLDKSGGCIVNIADAQVDSGVPGFAAYIAAKSALVSVTKSLGVELAPRVRVNAILPGSLPWPVDAVYNESEVQEMTQDIPMGRIGEWDDIVKAVEYLAGASYVTGTCLTVDGGRSAIY